MKGTVRHPCARTPPITGHIWKSMKVFMMMLMSWIIYNPDPDNQADEVVLVLDEFLATNDLDDITLTQIELL